MRTSKKERAERCVLIEMMLGIQGHLAARTDSQAQSVIMMAIRLGVYQGRPMDLSGIAVAVSMPRTSVIRYVKELEARGKVVQVQSGRRTVPILKDIEDPTVDNFYAHVKDLVIKAAANLSKLDTSRLDTRFNKK